MTGFSAFIRILIFLYLASFRGIIQEEKGENNWRIPIIGKEKDGTFSAFKSTFAGTGVKCRLSGDKGTGTPCGAYHGYI